MTSSPSCSTFVRSELDQRLDTTPPQTIADATLTRVTAPNGTFQVIWASSTETNVQRSATCEDGSDPATDTGFVATLLSP